MDKVLKIYEKLNLKEKIELMNLLLHSDSFVFLQSDLRQVGFENNPSELSFFATQNGTKIQVTIDMDTLNCTAVPNQHIKKIDDIKANTFCIPTTDKCTDINFKIREALRASGLTQDQMANGISISRPYFNRIITKNTKTQVEPSVDLLTKLCNFLKIDVEFFQNPRHTASDVYTKVLSNVSKKEKNGR